MPLATAPLGALPLGADGGRTAFTLTGQTGAIALSGETDATSAGRRTPAAAGSFSLAGSQARFHQGTVLPGASGAIALTGSSAKLDAPARHLDGATGSFTLTGQAAQTPTGREMPGETAHVTLSGSGTPSTQRQAPEQTGQFGIAGSAATLGGARRPTTPIALLLAAAIDGNAPCIGFYTVPPADIFDLGYEGVIAIGISMEATATAQP